MSHALYLNAILTGLRDRVLPKVDDSEARGVLEAAVRALAGLSDAIDTSRTPPPLLDFAAEPVSIDAPPENAAARPNSAAIVALAGARLQAVDWTSSPAGIAEARMLVTWERDRMQEAVSAMTDAERPRAADIAAGPDPLIIQGDAVEAYFQEKCGPSAKVAAIRQATGGRSRQTALVTLEGDTGLPREIVIQRDHPAGISPQSIVVEYPVLARIASSRLKAPRPLMVEHSPTYLGAPFTITARAMGVVAGPDYFSPPGDTGLALQLAEQLALLHAVDPGPLTDNLRATLPAGDDWSAELARLEATFNSLQHWPSIAATAAFVWMHAHVGVIDDGRTLVHNDAAFHNILVDGGEITALLDWELVHIGHPAEDLGYCRPFIQEMGVWDDFVEAYVAAGGRRFPKTVIDYFSLRGQLHLMTLLQNGGRRLFENGVTNDINLAEVGASFMPKVMLRLANVLSAVLDDQENACGRISHRIGA